MRKPPYSLPGRLTAQAVLAQTCAGLFLPTSAPAAVVALDARGGYDTYHNLAHGDGFADFRALTVAEGATLVTRSTFTEDSLLNVDWLALLQPYSSGTAYSAEEIIAIEGFVSRGGGLLVLGEGGTGSNSAYLNALTTGFGVQYAITPSEALGNTITEFVPHPLTAGVQSAQVDYQRRLALSTPAVDLTAAGGGADFLAVSGNAVFLSDSSVFMNPDGFSDANLATADNTVLARNIVRHLATVPEPQLLAPAASLVVLAWGLWRKTRNFPR